MRVNKVLKSLLGLGRDVVIIDRDLFEADGKRRARLEILVRLRASRRGRCGRCGASSPWFDQGDGMRSWRHIDVGFAVCWLFADARRVTCPEHGETVVAFPFARHDSSFTRALEPAVGGWCVAGTPLPHGHHFGPTGGDGRDVCGPVPP